MEKIKNLNRLNDVFFKSLLGDEKRKNLTLAFLNEVLNRDEQNLIIDINFMDKERIPDQQGEKSPELDILARTNEGTIINIEVQIANQEYFSKRSLYYWARIYAYQLKTGERYKKLKPTIAINLLQFDYLPYETYHNCYHVANDETHDILTNDLEMHFIELTKFKLSDVKRIRKNDWIAYFSPNCTDEQREEIAMTNPAIKEALNYEMMFSQDEIKRYQYDLQEKAIRDYAEVMDYRHKEGIQEGIQKEKYNMAKQMLFDGVDINFIAKYTKLSIEDINNLKNSNE